VSNKNLRIGTGFDIHRLVEGKRLILGGIHIPHHVGLHGTSDGDALIHAIIDALLGATCLGDIGISFPVDDPKYDNADSTKLLAQVMEQIKKAHWSIINIDSTIVCEQPRLSPWYEKMRLNLSQIMEIPKESISVKAKTCEKLGDIGNGAAVAVQVVALLEKG
jgi:2-C-methyl-D-erythritol 2,4-cyclodiphosphate synthase